MKRISLIAVTCILASGCGLTAPPPIPNPDRLPAEALTLEYVMGGGCLSYLLNDKSEDDAMKGVNLNRIHPGPSLDPGGNQPYWKNILKPGGRWCA